MLVASCIVSGGTGMLHVPSFAITARPILAGVSIR